MIDIYSRGVARIRHATTGEVYEIDAAELEWEAVGSEERQMGPENSYAAVIDHPELGQLSWSLWEYPVGMENMVETEVNDHELLENIEFGLQHLPDDDEYAEQPLPLALRLAALPAQLDELDRALARLQAAAPMLGHNRPPEEYHLELPQVDLDGARDSIADIRGELAKPDAMATADGALLQKAEGRIRLLSTKILGWLKWAGKLSGAGLVTGIGTGVGKELWEDPVALYDKLASVAETLVQWIQHIGSM
ncbi:hypothetical protein QQS45_06480 [Alteriqipengyuania flavescens]|uniref:hypothetical protein n=1 Tax=Alteriqipengyuania flavescens TaxID=3053610 RepID=UPI0025B4A0C0|nr:hypothetical protein [Alteriqipengyuania flavescens]WJY19855.1 hypothetical protein QQW98_06475 [Alteriqipengyuania flavescens]WJY25797.1 hypothetical protein QQS45_06480 [Alteriqipengyuania flavescens]